MRLKFASYGSYRGPRWTLLGVAQRSIGALDPEPWTAAARASKGSLVEPSGTKADAKKNTRLCKADSNISTDSCGLVCHVHCDVRECPGRDYSKSPTSGRVTANSDQPILVTKRIWPAVMAFDFSIGDRVRVSAAGATRSPRLADRTGIIVGRGVYKNSYVVLFDGNKTTTTFHGDYLEPIRSDIEKNGRR